MTIVQQHKGRNLQFLQWSQQGKLQPNQVDKFARSAMSTEELEPSEDEDERSKRVKARRVTSQTLVLEHLPSQE